MDGNDEEGDICRVCRTGGSPDRPLNYPCKCSGSIRFIHQDCLLMWLQHSKTKYCELCGHQFEFTPIYAENAPTVLPPHEILLGLLKRASVGMRGGLRIALVVLSWFVIVPLATSFTFYMYFGRPAYEFSVRQLRFSGFMTDCAFGTFISATIIFVCLLIMSLMDFVNNMHVMEHNRVGDGDLQNQNQNQNNINQNNLQNQNDIQNQNQDPQNNDGEDHPDIDSDDEDDGNNVVDDVIAQYNEVMDQINNLHHPVLPPLPAAPPPNDNNDNAPPLAAPAAQGVVGEEEGDDNMLNNMLFGFLDGNAGEVDFNELVGVVGPVTALISKVVALILFNACFLALFALVPLQLGKFILQLRNHPVELIRMLAMRLQPLHILPSTYLNFTSFVSENITSPVLDNATSVLDNATSVLNNATSVLENATSLLAQNATSALVNATAVLEGATSSTPSENPVITLEGTNPLNAIPPLVGDLDAVFVGYLFIATFCLLWIGITLTLTANLMRSRNLYRTIRRTLRLVLTAVKVACVMFSELVVFPLLVGIALDGCTVMLFGSSIESRVAFRRRSPFLFQILHWCVGFAYMIFFASFVGWVREVVRPGVLWFFRDPSDPNFNPLKDIVDHPASRHVKRLLMSVLIYGVIIGLLVLLPIVAGKHFWPSLFPLNIWLGDPFYEGPIDLIFVHVIVPYTLEYCHPKANFKALLRAWIVFMSHKLGIAEYMLPNPNAPVNLPPLPNNNANNNPLPLPNPPPAPIPPQNNNDDNNNAFFDELFNNNPPPLPNNNNNAAQPVLNNVYKPPHFGWRIFILLNLAWMSMFIVNSALVSIPIVLGRFLFLQLSFPLTNDLYTFCAGFYALYGAVRLAQATITFMTSLPLPQIVTEVCMYAILGIKCTIIALFLGVIIPLLIGLVFELVVAIPWRVPGDQSPHFFIYQDWGLGLIYLKVWYRIVAARAEHIRLHPARAHQDGFDLHALEWKAKFDQIFQDGIRNLHLGRVFTSIIFPLLDKVLIMLCVPYIVAKGIIPLAGGSLLLSSLAYRYGYLAFAGGIGLAYLQRPLLYSFRSLHNAIRDDKYLVGRQLHNYTTAMS